MELDIRSLRGVIYRVFDSALDRVDWNPQLPLFCCYLSFYNKIQEEAVTFSLSFCISCSRGIKKKGCFLLLFLVPCIYRHLQHFVLKMLGVRRRVS